MTLEWRCTPELSPAQRLDVLNLLDRTEAALGREALDEGRRRAVLHRGAPWPVQHWLAYVGDALVGYAQGSATVGTTIEMAGGGFDAELLTAALAHHPVVNWWTRDVHPAHDTHGGVVVRTLQLMRVSLPVPPIDVPAGAHLRTFEPERDAAAWLAQNNAAFADHPEQGAWQRADLDERIREPWFDPSGFVVLELDGRLAASCWTKVHELNPDRIGEIYVISVDPAFQGRRLGRVMVTQGLEVLRRKGVSSAVLFVDESNAVARALYESIGFTVRREDHLIRFSR